MTGIKVRCYTNLDGYSLDEWPGSLPAVPSVGQRVRAKSGAELKIIGLTWTHDALVIELHRGGAL